MKLTFDRLVEANSERQALWPGAEKADIAFRTIEVAGEAGELAEAMKKYIRGQRGIKGTTQDLTAVSDEIGDVIIATALLAEALGIDLGEAVAGKFNKTSDKYDLPVKL